MENGGGNHLENKLASLGLNDSDNNNGDGLFQVIKAVEAAEVTIKEQVEENNRLRSELQKKIAELETYKSQSDEHVSQIVSNIRSQKERKSDEHEGKKVNGASALRVVPGQVATENYGFSQLSSPSMTSFSPIRYQAEGESDRRLTLSGQGLMTLSDLSSASLKEDLGSKIREFEEEIMQLKKHLSEYSVKEAQIHNDKHVLEKRIAYMRMAFDQQQQDLVDAASKAISYRQDIIEENIRLTYALQDAQQERSAFVSTLMPLLAEYSLQPPVSNAQSIVSNVKVLFRHLHEKLMLTEAKLKESQYQMLPWRSDMNNTNVTNSPSHVTGMKDGLELVTQQEVTGAYQDGNQPISPDPPQGRRTTIWGDAQNNINNNNNNNNNSNISVAPKSPEQDDLWRYSPISSRETVPQNIPVDHGRKNEETNSKQVTFGDLVSNSDIDDNEIERQQSDVDPTWTPTKTSPYNNNNNTNTTPDEPSTSYSPYLPPVLEEPNSSYSEAADDDPLPGIEGLQISGEAFPGRELQACGYSVNGTTSCNFEWVRHLEDGSFNYIDGAKQPNYLVTADDVDTHLAIEVQPLDNRKRKGELVKVFTNDHRKITCDQEMHNCIARTANSGHASYKVSLSMGYIDMWEPATLSIKKDGYSIKGSGASGVIVSEKYSQSTIVSIPFGSVMEFSILDSQGVDRLLRAENSSTDVSCSRDTIVLTLRLFILRAIVKKKSKKRGLFFTK